MSTLILPAMVTIMVVSFTLQYLATRGRGSTAICIVAWLVLAVSFGLLMGSFNLRTLHTLATRGARTTGTVTALLPKQHSTARYLYQVSGQVHSGCWTPWKPNPPLESLKVGQTIVVYYDPASPATSVLGDPRPMLSNEVASVATAALLFPTLIVFGQVWQARRARRRGLRG